MKTLIYILTIFILISCEKEVEKYESFTFYKKRYTLKATIGTITFVSISKPNSYTKKDSIQGEKMYEVTKYFKNITNNQTDWFEISSEYCMFSDKNPNIVGNRPYIRFYFVNSTGERYYSRLFMVNGSDDLIDNSSLYKY